MGGGGGGNEDCGLWCRRRFKIVDSIGYEDSMGRVRNNEIGGGDLTFWCIG